MKLFEAAKSVSLTDIFTEMCGGTIPNRRKNSLTSCPICGAGTNTPCFGLYGKTKNILDKYKCFSCGAQGDSISLVKNVYGLVDDVEAAKEICRYFNVEYEETKASVHNDKYDKYVRTYNYIAKLFNVLYRSDFNPDKNYFENRGLSTELIDKYQLGYCPNMLITKENKHISLQDLILRMGLTVEEGLVNSYGESVFSGRYIFPIRNSKGDVIAFSGRTLDANAPKYVNTCETEFFKKSFALFNYDRAKAYPTVYVVEGYMDALSLIESGIPNVVAAMGTAFTESHISALKGKQIVLALDHDGAGMTHIFNIITQFRDIYFKVMYTPQEYKDFNEMLMAKQDIKSYLSKYELKAGPEFVIRLLTHTQDMSKLESRSDIWKTIASLIGSTNYSYQKKYPLNTLYTPVEIDYFWKMYSKFIKRNRKEVK
jgi:DNA primase catalytic core